MSERVLRTAAKVNLSLRLLSRRDDGFHELDTVFQTIDLGDELTIDVGGTGIELFVDDPSLPSDGRNLVHRAAERLQQELGERRGARLSLRKRVPAGGGLGGGSGDAAAALLGLASAWGKSLSAEKMAALALELGSDVPFFLVGGRARGSGRGEILTPLDDLAPEEVLLVAPPGELSTASVYARLAARRASAAAAALTRSEAASTIRASEPESAAANDLEPAVFDLRPELLAVRDQLLRRGAASAMVSGSGISLYARFPNGVVPAGSEDGWPDGFRVWRCRWLGRSEYRSRLEPVGIES